MDAGSEIDFEAEGLLDGLEGEQRAERLALLRELAADGVPLADLRRTTASGTVMFLPADRMIVSDARYTAAQIAELSGIEPEMLNALSRAMGLPIVETDEPIYTDLELDAARRLQAGRALGIPDEETLALLRVLGRSLSQAAESLRAIPLKMVIEPGLSEAELAKRYARGGRADVPARGSDDHEHPHAAPAPRDAGRGRQRAGAKRRGAARSAGGRGRVRRPGRVHAARRGSPAG